jgi:hypothetical protein
MSSPIFKLASTFNVEAFFLPYTLRSNQHRLVKKASGAIVVRREHIGVKDKCL